MAKENISGKMALIIKENSKKGKLKDMGKWCIRMVNNTRVIGKTVKWTDLDNLNGQMVQCILEITRMTRNTV